MFDPTSGRMSDGTEGQLPFPSGAENAQVQQSAVQLPAGWPAGRFVLSRNHLRAFPTHCVGLGLSLHALKSRTTQKVQPSNEDGSYPRTLSKATAETQPGPLQDTARASGLLAVARAVLSLPARQMRLTQRSRVEGLLRLLIRLVSMQYAGSARLETLSIFW